MHPGSDMGGPGFSSRRPNASNLPNFELPPPPLSSQKYQYAVSGSQASQTPGSLASVGNLLTPPSTIGGEGVTSPAGNVSTSSAPSNPPYTNGGFASWSPSTHAHPPYYQQHQSNSHPQAFQQQRVPYSPASTIVRGHPHSPPTSDGGQIPGQAYELPPFPASTPMSAPATLPTMAPQQQHHQQQHHHQQQQHQHQQQMHNQMMGNQTPVSSSGPQPSPVHAQEAFRPPPTPTYYSHPQTPQQSPYPPYTGPPSQNTPLSAGPMSGRPQMSPASAGPSHPLSAPPVQSPHAYQGRFAPFQAHGPVMSNIHNPNGQPMLVGGLPPGMMQGFNSGHAATMHQMYNQAQSQPQTPQNDRPFKCDQCPQSFNRNHDLKRHKRIHLAVKPFPCGHCDKSFSRKDALKRHVLVKGCGKAKDEADAAKAEAEAGSMSPNDGPTKNEDADSKPAASH